MHNGYKRAIVVKRARGMSLIELMIAVGIMAVILSSMSTMLYQFLKAQSLVASRDETNDFAASLAAQLVYGAECTKMMQGLELPEAMLTATETFTSLSLPNWGIVVNSSPAVGKILSDTHLTPKIKVAFLGMQRKPGAFEKISVPIPDPMVPGNFIPGEKYRTIAQIKLNVVIKEGSGNEKALPSRYFDVPVILNSLSLPRIIDSCRTETSLKEACEAVAGNALAWNSVLGSCNVDKQKCKPYGTFIMYDFPPTANPAWMNPSPGADNPLTGNQTCPSLGASLPPAIPYLTGSRDWTTTVNVSKKSTQTINHTERFYMCLSCEP